MCVFELLFQTPSLVRHLIPLLRKSQGVMLVSSAALVFGINLPSTALNDCVLLLSTINQFSVALEAVTRTKAGLNPK